MSLCSTIAPALDLMPLLPPPDNKYYNTSEKISTLRHSASKVKYSINCKSANLLQKHKTFEKKIYYKVSDIVTFWFLKSIKFKFKFNFILTKVKGKDKHVLKKRKDFKVRMVLQKAIIHSYSN